MTFKQITVVQPMQTTRVNEDCKTIGDKPQRYFKIELDTKDFGTIHMIIWENNQPEVFEQLLNATDNLEQSDFPRITNIKCDGIVVHVSVPEYKFIAPEK